MSDYEFPPTPHLEDAYRAAHRALERVASDSRSFRITKERDMGLLTDVISHMRILVDEAEIAAAAQIGSLIGWRAPREDGDWDLILCGVDFDEAAYDFGPVEFGDSALRAPSGDWHGSPLDVAARAYKREAGWDFAPGEAGIWLLMLAPTSGAGGGGDWGYSGHLVGFVILHDRDKDGEYESVAHIWTASAWRRRGIARRLLAEARSRFPIAAVEGPYTEDGAAFLRAVGELEGAGD